MRSYLLFFIMGCVTLSCSNSSQSTDEQSEITEEGSEGEITAESMEAYRQKAEAEGEGDESYRGLQDGNYYLSTDIKNHLSSFGAATQYMTEGKITFASITKDNQGKFLKACDYDQTGTYRILNGNNEDGESILDGIEYPVLEHSSDDATMYKIEEIDISEQGRKISMEVRRLDFSNGEYSEDMAIETEHVDISLTDQDQMIMVDHIYDVGSQRYFMQSSIASQLPKAECQDDHHQDSNGTTESLITGINIKYGGSGLITDQQKLMAVLDEMKILSVDFNSKNSFGKTTIESGEYVTYSSFVGFKYFVKDKNNTFSEIKDISANDYPVLIDSYQMTDIYKVESIRVTENEIEIGFKLLKEEEPTEKTDAGYSFKETFKVVDSFWVMSDHKWDYLWVSNTARDNFRKISDD